MDLSRQIAGHLSAVSFDDLPPDAVEITKRSLLDAIGVTLAASALGEGCRAFVDLARAAGRGTPESTILGFGDKVSAPLAALANGAMAHAIDYEDAYDGAPLHPNAAMVAAVLAEAQAIGGVSGRDLPNNAVDTIPVEHFVGSACVLDCTSEATADADFLLTAEWIKQWEAGHGRIPPRAWVLMRTGWSKRSSPAAYQNFDATGQHTPGPDTGAVRFLVEERDVLGFGTETIGTDAGQGYHLKPPYPCHSFMHGAGRYGLQCLNNLDQLPPTGAVIFAAPLKIQNGSGSPLRVLALVTKE